MLTHTVIVAEHPGTILSVQKAISFCEAIINRGDQLKQVFFMHDATFTAVHDNASLWCDFAEQHDVTLQTCVSTAEQNNICLADYHERFLQGGLSMLADALLSSDAVHQFSMDEADFAELSHAKTLSKNKLNIVFNSAPYAGSLAAEGVDLLLVLSAFEAELIVFFEGDGIKNISQKNSGGTQGDMPKYVKRFKALHDFEIDNIFVVDDSGESVLPVKNIAKSNYLSRINNQRTLRF